MGVETIFKVEGPGHERLGYAQATIMKHVIL